MTNTKWLTALAATLIGFTFANPSLAHDRESCDEILLPKYDLTPFRAHLFRTKRELSTKLGLWKFDIQNESKGFYSITLWLGDSRWRVIGVDYGDAVELSHVDHWNGGDWVEFSAVSQDRTPTELDFYVDLVTLAGALIIPAVFPEAELRGISFGVNTLPEDDVPDTWLTRKLAGRIEGARFYAHFPEKLAKHLPHPRIAANLGFPFVRFNSADWIGQGQEGQSAYSYFVEMHFTREPLKKKKGDH